MKWQAALTHGLHKARADAWLKTATRNDRDRVKEMAGDWIMDELPWWTHFRRPCWLIAMRLRYGLAVTPAIILNTSRRCLAKKQDGSFCLELLDDLGRHAQVCKVEGTAVHRHDTIRDGLVPGLKPHVSSVKLEQFIYELAQLNEDTGETKEARMDIVADMPQLRAMLDVRCYLSTLASGWRSARAHEAEKHQRYVTHCNGRRCTNMVLFAAVVNTYGYVGKEFENFCAVIDGNSRGANRGRSLVKLLSLLGVYANAEKVLLAHAPSKKRSQREDVIAAIAAKDAAAAAPAAAPIRENQRPVVAQHGKKVNRTAKKRPDLKEPVQHVRNLSHC